MPTPESPTPATDQPPAPPAEANATPPNPDMAGGDETDEAEDDLLHTDASLQKLEDKLDDALSDLGERNHSVEAYLDTLAQQRKRDLLGANAGQLTLDDIPQPPAETPAAPDAAPEQPNPTA